MAKRHLLLLFSILPLLSYARGGKVFYQRIVPEVEPPWLTGPLIASSAHVVPVGHYNIEPYIYVTGFPATYQADWKTKDLRNTFWNTQLQIPIQVGLTTWLDLSINPILNWNYCNHKGAWRIGDLSLGFDIQLYESAQDSLIPYFKLALRETLPIAKYRNLNPNPAPKYLIDGGGTGTWVTGVSINFGNLYHLCSVYYANYRLNLNYSYSAPVHIKGFNYYGGGYGTNGRVFP